jgi:hypothetical protein
LEGGYFAENIPLDGGCSSNEHSDGDRYPIDRVFTMIMIMTIMTMMLYTR